MLIMRQIRHDGTARKRRDLGESLAVIAVASFAAAYR